jgi:hypothetical protein
VLVSGLLFWILRNVLTNAVRFLITVDTLTAASTPVSIKVMSCMSLTTKSITVANKQIVESLHGVAVVREWYNQSEVHHSQEMMNNHSGTLYPGPVSCGYVSLKFDEAPMTTGSLNKRLSADQIPTNANSTMSVEALDDLFAKLNVQPAAKGTVDFSSEHVVFTAWKAKPSQTHVSPKLDRDQLRRILEEDLEVDSDPAGIAQLKTAVTTAIQFQPFARHVDPEAKPNLLVLVSSIFHRYLQDHTNATPDQLVSSLQAFDVLMPRNPLKKVLAAALPRGETWEVFAMRPLADGPLFVERTKSYSTNPGSVGMLFEREMTTQPAIGKYHRVYAVRAGQFGQLKIALTGEVDCVHPANSTVVEIKSKPEWARRDETRDLETYIQCKLAGVETLVTGKFSSTRGIRNGPVTFHRRNTTFQHVDSFAADLLDKSIAAFAYGQRTLQTIDDGCTKAGQVYYASGQFGRPTKIRVAKPEEVTFPISNELIRELANVMAA